MKHSLLNFQKYCFLFLVILFTCVQSMFAQVTMSSTGSHTQNFNSLTTSTTASTWTDNSTIANWYSQRTGTGTTIQADTGSGTGGTLYSYGANADSDRALGSIGSGNAAAGSFAHGVLLRNVSGVSITNLKVSYTLEQWRNGGNTTANTVTFWYKISTSPISALNPNSNGTWTQVTGLSLSSPINTATSGALNGNSAANRVSLANISIPSLNIANNSYIMLKWEDPDHTGTDHGLAIDDVTINWTVTSPSTISVSGSSSYTYNGLSQGPSSANVNGSTGNVTYSYSGTGLTTYGPSATPPSVVGTYSVVASVAADSNYDSATSAGFSFVIGKANLMVTAGNQSVTQGASVASVLAAGTSTITGYVNGENSSVVSGSVSYSTNYLDTTSAGTPGITITPDVSGLTAANYNFSPANGTITVTSTQVPTISSAFTAVATYGTSFSYQIVADSSPTSYNATNLPAGLSINTATGEISGIPTAAPGLYNVGLVATNAGGDGTATLSLTLNAKSLTITGIATVDRIYNATNAVSYTGGTLVGVYGGDTVSFSGSATMADKVIGTNKPVTFALTLNGAQSGNYSLTQPTGLTVNISAKELTISGVAAQNKTFDGNTNAVITGTLSGVEIGDTVTLSGTGTFATSAIGTNIAVTSTSTIGGADAGNYYLTQPTGLTANIVSGPTTLSAGDVAVIAINSATPDSFSVVLLKDIGQNTVINFTDNGFTGTDTTGRTGEGFLTFTAPSELPYGTVLTWTNGMSIAGTGWSSNAPASFAFSGSGDQLFTFQGSTTNWASQSGITLIHGINYGIALSGTSGASNTLQPNASILPATAFINLPTSTFANGYFSNTGTSSTSVTVCGTPAQVLAALVTPAKWFGTSATTATFPSLTILNVCPTPTISVTGTLSAVNTIYGTSSVPTTFNVSGVNMNAAITATAPQGYEISLSSGTGYSSSVSFGSAGTIASTTLYLRIASTTAVGAYSGNVVLTSTGAADVNVVTVASTVSPKELTITGLTANSKVFDGNTDATLSGTAVLNGVVNGDVVVLGGSPVATFATSAVGTNIVVSVTGYSISGSGATNYSLTQPSLFADITTEPTPVITSILTATATYGLVATTYVITASESPIAFNASGLPSGLSINTTTGEITGTPTAVPGTYNVTISATNNGGTGNATLLYTILAKPLTVTDAIANNKVYTKTNEAIISGSVLVGVVGGDVVTISSTGTFSSVLVGTGIVVTSTQTLSGADAFKYSLTLPTGLTADITPKPLTLTGAAAQNKPFDGTTAATITGTLSGVVLGDTVTLNGTGTFATAAQGTGIPVTSTATLAGTDAANYTLTQPTGLTANITQPVLYLNQFTGASACPTNGNVPVVSNNATGTPLTRSTIVCNPTINVFNSTTLNATATVNSNSYIEFSVSANTGKVLNLQALSFLRQASNTAPNQIEVRYSTDGFTTFTSWVGAPLTPTSGSVATWNFPDFEAESVIFRIYPYGTQRADLGAGAASSGGSFRLDDVTVIGLVTNPSPPNASVISGSTSVCSGDSAVINVAITGGRSPYTLVYTDGTNNYTESNYVSGSSIVVSPASTTTYSIVSITDSNALVGTGNTGSAVITVLSNTTYYADVDGDGFGNAASSIVSCFPLGGYVTNNTDCDDTRASVNPGAVDVCYDGVDNDCNGNIDNIGLPGGCT
ncbi:MAG: hypothetical protein EWV88_04065, partial [Microcystis wesenbergii Mw_MB_S_20031200_S109D]